ncbi:MAG TPA: HNH endonuclease signature motif containing protein [Bosea sp. (in: a-proteobacteria)]|jgi:5-methylcytosine-specific restriction endonuclease McrA|uniref:HNH endonuclease signature motif containing protein n=1 Tax=Bosea sp. (in: a-proteobacteria) TaxID=1871050 RepID=UPI002E0E9B80|nr:HNH endonuclease signature motif containing protein [Bosea sp. (in: a-proteobacteria)]
MSRPPRLCSCANIVAYGVRCECQRAQDRQRKAGHDRRRPPARERGYDHEWRKARLAYLAEHPHCRMCSAPATTVDHIIRHRGDRALFWNRANWQPLCAPCHNRIKQRIERGNSR